MNFCVPAAVKSEVVVLYEPTATVKLSVAGNGVLSVSQPVQFPAGNFTSTVAASFAVQFVESPVGIVNVPAGLDMFPLYIFVSLCRYHACAPPTVNVPFWGGCCTGWVSI